PDRERERSAPAPPVRDSLHEHPERPARPRQLLARRERDQVLQALLPRPQGPAVARRRVGSDRSCPARGQGLDRAHAALAAAGLPVELVLRRQPVVDLRERRLVADLLLASPGPAARAGTAASGLAPAAARDSASDSAQVQDTPRAARA